MLKDSQPLCLNLEYTDIGYKINIFDFSSLKTTPLCIKQELKEHIVKLFKN